jgi:hypothetical protein
MRTLKRILIPVVAIILVVLIIAAFVKKNYAVEREIIIEKPRYYVFNFVKLLKNQNLYSKWANMDPDMKKEFHGTDGTVGFVSAWESKDKHVGKGEQEITKIEDGKRVDYEIRFLEPFKSTSPAYMSTDSLSVNQTLVKWGFSGKMSYPMNIMLVFMDMETSIGNDFYIGLKNLKQILENQ